MTIEELRIEIEQIRDDALDTLQEMHLQKIAQNTYGIGYESGTVGTCNQLLDLINEIQS